MNSCPYKDVEQQSRIGLDYPAIVVMLPTIAKIRYIRWSFFLIILCETLILEKDEIYATNMKEG